MFVRQMRGFVFLVAIVAVIGLVSAGDTFANSAHKGPIVGGAIAANGSVLVTMSDHPDHTLMFYDPSTGKGLRRMATGQLGHQSAIALSPNGKLAACGTKRYGGDNNELIIVDAEKGKILHKMRIHVPQMENVLLGVLDLQFSPDGKKLLVTTNENLGFIYNPVSGKQLSHFQARIGGLTGISAAWMPDGKRVLLGSKGDAALVDTTNGKVLKTYSDVHRANFVDVSADGRFAVIADVAKLVVIEVESGKNVVTFDNKNQVTGVVIGAHSPLVACTDVTQKFVTLYNIKAKKQVARAPIPAPFLDFPGMSNVQVAGLSVDDQTRLLVVNAPAMPYIIPLGAKK